MRFPYSDGRCFRLVFLQWLLLGLFALRVAAQFIQKVGAVDFLPPFDAWQSGTLSYPVLLGTQLLLLSVMAAVNFRLASGRFKSHPRLGEALLSVGALYFSFMLFRLGASLTFAAGQPFLGATLPAFFHLVISGWLLGVGRYCRNHPDASAAQNQPARLSHWLVYPVVMFSCLWLYCWLTSRGFGVWLSTYFPVAAGAGAITFFERVQPCREEWHPDNDEVRHDLIFMGLVQMLLPKALTFLIAVGLLHWLKSRGYFLADFWPHTWPVAGQVALMILCGDFLRYWLHRASHEWLPWLWRFHAVHHSVHKLNWVNVGRFHPIEKSFQFLCDAAPFILLGVSTEVLAVYFVLYAVNGFFQHCNIELRLGLLNYVISGPELHRWHHSWEPRESNRNYGNNIITWDLLFGTYFLPGDRRVGLLGLRNRKYPAGFLQQMRTPFIRGIDQAEDRAE